MAKFDFTPEDVARGTILQPGWYPAEVIKVEDKPAKTDGSNVSHVTLRILEAFDSKGDVVNNVPLLATFSIKAAGAALGFVNSLGANVGKEGKKGVDISTESCGARRLQVFVKNDQWEGRTINKAADYRPAV